MSNHDHESESRQFALKPARLTNARASLGRVAMAALLVATFGAGVGVERYGIGSNSSAGASSSMADVPEFQTLQETWDLIQNDYVDPAAVEDQRLIYGAARGMVDSLGDTGHSSFLDPDEAEAFLEATRGELIGIGVEVDFSTGVPVIIAPIDGSPAAEAGVKSKDVIVAIDGVSVDGMTRVDVFRALRGDEGTTVDVTLMRPSEQREFTVTLTRSKIVLKPVSWTMLPGNVVFIRLSEFMVGATDGVKDAIEEAKQQGATSAILDLRDNPGGLVFEAIGVASQFLPEGTPIYQFQEKGDEPRPIRTTGIGLGTELELIVLVNGGSASSAEIVASAMQDNGRAILIGETTFGTGTVLTPNELEDGSIVLLGTGLWLTAKGNQLWHVGVTPTITIVLADHAIALRPPDVEGITSAELLNSEDTQLSAAYVELTS